MGRYAVIIFIYSALINGTLLLGVGRIGGRILKVFRWIAGAAITGIYTMICCTEGDAWISHVITRIVVAALIGLLSYGRHLREIILYMLISFLLEPVIRSVNSNENKTILSFVLVILLLYVMTLQRKVPTRKLLPVELQFAGKSIKLTALCDTGNLLRDPITGGAVLIVGLRISQELTGLTKQQLQHPIDVMRHPPMSGMRLIPYKTISESNGFILGMRMCAVRIGDWKGRVVVAFAPEEFARLGEFEALTGGVV